MNENVESKIISIIDRIRPYIISDGGNIEFVRYENGVVYIRLLGACAQCQMIDVTLNNGIEELLINEIPEVKCVKNISQ